MTWWPNMGICSGPHSRDALLATRDAFCSRRDAFAGWRDAWRDGASGTTAVTDSGESRKDGCGREGWWVAGGRRIDRWLSRCT